MTTGTVKTETCDGCGKVYLHGPTGDEYIFPFGLYISKGLVHQEGRYDILKNLYACSKECAHKVVDDLWDKRD